MHSQKIDNALRTVDTWYPESTELGPIAVEPYGSVTNRGKAYRQPKDKMDFYTLLDGWIIKDNVPAIDHQHRVVKRVQVKSSAERLRRRSVNKGWLSEAAAIERIPLSKEKQSKFPFLELKSNSNEQTFRLFIWQMPLQSSAVAGRFSDYGLSEHATTPYF